MLIAFLSGCSGQLVIEGLGQGPDSACFSSAQCGLGKVCQNEECVDSDGRCSVSIPDGDCPLGRVCQAGICVSSPIDSGNDNNNNGGGTDNNNNGNTPVDVFDCSQCATGLLCDGFECVDPTDSAKVCSESIPTGACPLEEVCVAVVFPSFDRSALTCD
ncbi:MAG: hypothetical protein AAFQ82_01520, partial [Myxococcota bacterium]